MNAQTSAASQPAEPDDGLLPPEFWPNVDDLVTEDDTPVDNIFSERQQRLLTEPLYSSWRTDRPFVAFANVGLFFGINLQPLVPDVQLSLGVQLPEEVWSKRHRSYFVWEYGKPPDVVIAVVSNKEGHEADSKLRTYAEISVKYYAVYDPERLLSKRLLRLYVLHGMEYVEMTGHWLEGVGLGLCTWEGEYEDLAGVWLRWCDREDVLIPTGQEQAEQANRQAAQAQQQAAQAQEQTTQAQQQAAQAERQSREAEQQAVRERQRAERLAQRLRAMGIDPDQ